MNGRHLLACDLLVPFARTGWALSIPCFGSEFVAAMALGLLLILPVLYLPGGLASLRWTLLRQWCGELRDGWQARRYAWSGAKARDEGREKARRVVL
ncbi:MAG TPA: hypothetical protein PKB14_04840 [Rubrivivax sp.]|nr:hypothetical protein [Rubrivivax sp.]